MLNKILRNSRIILALISLVGTSLVFINIHDSTDQFSFFSNIQFLPSLLRFMQVPVWSACAFIVILIITFFCGRIYCSIICPLGILQDIFARFGRVFKIRKKYTYSKPRNILRYSILVIVIISFFSGVFSFIPWLDPYSIFGRIATHLFRPTVYFLNNLVSTVFGWFDSYAIPYMTLKRFSISVTIISAIYLIIFASIAIFRGRLYCNTICPVGSLLSLVSRYQIFGIRIGDGIKCLRCKKCASVCKSECIDVDNLTFDYSRCVSCFNCSGLGVCKFSGLHFLPVRTSKKEKKESYIENSDNGRRKFFMIASTIPSLFVFLGIRIKGNAAASQKSGQLGWKRQTPITPPGSIGREHFLKYCTACHACVNACPSKVIQPTLMEYGLKGMMVPRMDFGAAFCNYECNLCGKVCPSNAIQPFSTEQKKVIQMGKARFIPKNCVTIVYHRHCGACAEHCPTRAIKMVFNGKTNVPQVDDGLCVGCGACEFICPTRPYRAIYVEPCENHRLAQQYKEEQQQKTEQEYKQEDFPF